MKGERTLAGLSCSQVLARLSDYLDGDLERAERDRVEAHVRGCDHCARFGGVFAEVVRTLRADLGSRELPEGARDRILDRL